MLAGKKSYLLAGAVALATFAKAMGWIGDDLYTAMLGFLGAGSVAALRAGIARGIPR